MCKLASILPLYCQFMEGRGIKLLHSLHALFTQFKTVEPGVPRFPEYFRVYNKLLSMVPSGKRIYRQKQPGLFLPEMCMQDCGKTCRPPVPAGPQVFPVSFRQ